jgi:ABC-type Fe3+-hydroxamate transport system substrate-binding protein
MISVEDQFGNLIQLQQAASRIVSLVPSQTELLHYFGLEKETLGITKFCIHPDEWFRSKIRVGGTKNVNIQKVKDLQPDLIIANKEENTEEDILELVKCCPVYISDINSVDEALQMVKDIGQLCGKEQIAVDLIDDITDDFQAFPQFNKSVVYLIWRAPYMACGTNNFINAMMGQLALKNLVHEPRYVEISLDEISKLNPDVVLLSTEPFPFDDKHKLELESKLNSEIAIVDGEMFSWYGSRMLKMKDYFDSLQL